MHQESVLHHFRCANVSPESTYEYDGQLRCPKCRHFLRHIGVDYDRPSEIYTCQDCGNTSLHSDMRVFCTQCHSTLKTSELHPFEIYEYEFTPKGQIAITSGQALLALAPDIWNGYTSFNQFRQLLHGFSNNSSSKDAVVTIRFKVAGNLMDEAKNMSLMQDIYIRFYYYNFTINPIRHCFYVSHRCMCDEIDAVKTWLETEIYGTIPEFLKRYDSNMHCTDRQVFIYRKGENIDMFLKQLNAITDY